MRIKEILQELVTTSAVGNPPPQKLGATKCLNNFFKKKKKKKKKLEESLILMKFRYTNYKNDKTPRVLVLDTQYPGIEGQKTYGQRDDVLGWNVNYYSNPKEAIKSINDIDTFSRMLSANKEEKYKRIKYFFPKQFELIRRYQQNFIKNPKIKKGLFWHSTDINKVNDMDKEAF